MSRRRFAIPVLTALGATGCSDPLIGSWNITQAAGETLPYSYVYQDTLYYKTATLNVTESLRASLSYIYRYTYSDGEPVLETDSVTGEATIDARKQYGITWDEEYRWDCGLPSRNKLSCTDSDGDSWSLTRWPIKVRGI